MSLTVTTGANANLLILFDVTAVQNNAASTGGYFQILVDGAAVTQSVDPWSGTGWQMHTVSLHHLKSGLSAGSHTVKVKWYTTGGNLLICQTGLGDRRSLTAIEL